ncbi:MAG: hypothetical protein OXU19_03095, partial [bacterium]|nr:hypothetical protein [bacterium]
MTKKFRHRRKRNALHDCLRGEIVPQIVKPHILNSCTSPHQIPDTQGRGFGHGPHWTDRTWKDVWTGPRLALDECTGSTVEIDRPRTGFAVAKVEHVGAHFLPLERPDLPMPASGTAKQADNV